ncbi:HAD-IIIA family hydrolase [Maribacter sp. MMG018]|uniref:KdsC family phosphatase n=1 Tax=Maribacter sp. MMG018 TaxID=2822688 RepID=UPI001B399535|nr:HAD-IIIA family hydrolase [Maribacter sp. MMG018]MBQ4913417.1 HAD-IIIA family hydrolase [Maribacter sp. MMG018]
MLPKLVLTDIDGVWTDGGMYYDEKGNEFKKFNTYDSAGILFCKLLNIPTGIITGESADSVKRRAKKLNVDYVYLGVKDKVRIVMQLCEKLDISLDEIAFIGDDINDYNLLQKINLNACPNSAPNYIKDIVNWVMKKNGGEGAFREFVEKILEENNIDIPELLKTHNIIGKFNQ